MKWLSLFLDTVKSHQLAALLLIGVFIYGSCHARRVFCKVFGDENYPSTDWVIVSLIMISIILASFLLICALVMSFTT